MIFSVDPIVQKDKTVLTFWTNQFSSYNHLLLHRAICDIFLQFNILTLRQANNILIHWCWFLILLLVGYCLLAITLLHSTVVHHSTNQCSKDEWYSTGDRCCNGNTGGARDTCYICVEGTKKQWSYHIRLAVLLIALLNSEVPSSSWTFFCLHAHVRDIVTFFTQGLIDPCPDLEIPIRNCRRCKPLNQVNMSLNESVCIIDHLFELLLYTTDKQQTDRHNWPLHPSLYTAGNKYKSLQY